MSTPYRSGGTPYIVPDGGFLQSWPVGVDWTTLPPGTNVTDVQRAGALANVCAAATASINGEMNFPLHCVLNTEQEQGPNYRVTYRRSTGEARMILSRWPVTNIASVRVAPSGVYPLQWTTVPAGYYRPEYPVIGHYNSNTPTGSGEGGQAILIAPPYVNWCRGRWGIIISAQYYHGWPHTHLTEAASAGDEEIQVADCTGWAPFTAGEPGAQGIVYDNLGGQEVISATAASAVTGPGTVSLASPLGYAHPANIMTSSFPADVIWCAVLFAAAEALTRGAQSTTVQVTPGGRLVSTGATGLRNQAKDILHRFQRTI